MARDDKDVLIRWDNTFNLGLEELDQDHKNLVACINDLNQLIRENAPSSEIQNLLVTTVGQLEDHFNRENIIIRQCQSDEQAQEHIQFHDETLAYFRAITEKHAADPDTIRVRDLLEEFYERIIRHVMDQDYQLRDDLERTGLVASDEGRPSFIENFLDTFKLTSRIAALAVIPLLIMLYFAGDAVLQKRTTVTDMEKIEKLSSMAGVFSNLVHELQKERGTSAGYLASNGEAFGDKVIAQRKNTDQKKTPVPNALTLGEQVGLKTEIANVRRLLGQLENWRGKISAQESSVGETVTYYSELNTALLNSIAAMSKISNNPQLSNRISAFVNFLQSKERAGLERAKGAAGFGAGAFSPGLMKDFISLIAIQDTYMNVARTFASPQTLAFMDETINGKPVEQVNQMRNIAINSPNTGDLQGVSGTQWFDTITQKINLLKQTEDFMAGALLKDAQHVKSDAQTSYISLSVLALGITGILVILMVVLIRSVIIPLNSLRVSLGRLEEGYTETMIAGRHKSDVIGEMARAIQRFKESIARQNMEQAKSGIEQTVRERTSTRRLEMTNTFRDEVAQAIQQMASAADQLEDSAAAMSSATESSRTQSSNVASAANQATSNVETVAAAAEELSSSIQEISRQVSHSSTIASSASGTVQEAQATIQGLADGAGKIGEVVQMITDIAEQTNMLALNATIEAARAGAAGKGFAVVASEVKNLAHQTAQATDDITRRIGAIQEDTRRAVEAISGVSETIEQMNDVTTTVSSAVDQQGSATQEISQNVNEAATGTRDVSDNIEGVASSNEETGRMSNQVFESAKLVAENSNRLEQQINTYLRDIASA